jgi:predicted outer membrane repeat protein
VTARIEGLIIQNGNASGYYGGGMLIDSSAVDFFEVDFTSNLDYAVKPTYVMGAGGAMYLSSSTVNLDGCSFSASKAANGGAMYIAFSIASLFDTTFTNNLCKAGGGAISVFSSDVTILLSEFISNQATDGGRGGAILIMNGNLLISESRFSNNTVDDVGVQTGATLYLGEGDVARGTTMSYDLIFGWDDSNIFKGCPRGFKGRLNYVSFGGDLLLLSLFL